MGGTVALALWALATSGYDPVIDTALSPHSGLSIGVGVQRVQDEFGLVGQVTTPRLLDDRLAITAAGGVGWYPDLRALPMSAEDQDFGAWSIYAHGRVLVELSTDIALASGRLYAHLGPSFMLLPARLSTTRFAIGGHGVLGVELFAGDEYRAFGFSFFLEVGAAAHAAAADVANRTGPIEEVDPTVDRPIGTGFVVSGGLRWYLWR